MATKLGLTHPESAAQVYTLATEAKGEKAALARDAYVCMGEMLGIGMTNVVHAVDPDIIIFGGGVSKASELFMPAMLEMVRQRCIVTPPEFAISTGPMALLGAASLVLG